MNKVVQRDLLVSDDINDIIDHDLFQYEVPQISGTSYWVDCSMMPCHVLGISPVFQIVKVQLGNDAELSSP